MTDQRKNNYETVLEEITKKFLTLDYEKAASASGCTYHKEKNELSLDFYGKPITIDCATGKIQSESIHDDPVGEKITIINYLNRYELYNGIPLSGKLVPLREVPGGGSLFLPAFKRMTLDPLAQAFGNNASSLYKALEPMKAKKSGIGHASITFNALPYIPITVTVWEGDDEIPPSANILYDSTVHYYAHIEDVIGLGGFAARKAMAYCI